MEVHYGVETFKNKAKSIVTSGTFDGLHFGHQKILTRLIELAKTEQGESVVLTFWPHPRLVLKKDYTIKLLSTLEEKIKLFHKFDIDHLVIIPFNKSFSKLSSLEFIQQILMDAVGTKKLVIGYDHRFGKNREGGFEYLQANATKFGFEVEEISKQEIDEIAVSSTKIRNALNNGEIGTANHYLGRKYELTGKVVHGKKLGRTIGFPTANIEVPSENKLIPKDGIYAVDVIVDNIVYQGMLNIGFNPTVDDSGSRFIEVNIFEFDSDIYGEEITILFCKYLREEEKFDSVETLKQQLKKDQIDALAYFSGL
ncbi:bifunctional riboflavin kinase/FAD synthetase [Chondrinema litorale]|uniref:bifunctional riboflavin kinase/FAD synthetase n=1 Tax=Chondrinema litorale TaxID=2994555 RepID=UPI002544BC69|nr:bifunctional riboflavin kinase/FAD synthetase [Chondrinema litorale]UZR94658.1 bifunctional riboflavin kinase/FAD synthetase [Chondrinema litorale]